MSMIESMTTIPGVPGWIPSRLRRISVEEYERLAASGIIPSSNRYHLINGYLLEKMTHNPPHATSFQRTGAELGRVVPASWHVRPTLPVRLPGQASMPEPDLCVARGSIDDYAERHPALTTSPCSWRSRIPRYRRTGRWVPRSMAPPGSRPTGSSSSTGAGSSPIPNQARKAIRRTQPSRRDNLGPW